MSRDIEKDLEMIEKATPGPWEIDLIMGDRSYGARGVCTQEDNLIIYDRWATHTVVTPVHGQSTANEQDLNNLDFIATAREALPYYINAYKEAQAEVERLKEMILAVTGWINAPQSLIKGEFADKIRQYFISTAGKDFLTEHASLRAEVERLRGALKYYADRNSYRIGTYEKDGSVCYSVAPADKGKYARKVLEGDGK
ncbi:MAG: hypothetical protein ACYDG6_11405 [Thermincolia bacterium]